MRTEAELEQLRADIAAQDRERQEAGQIRAEIERLTAENERLAAELAEFYRLKEYAKSLGQETYLELHAENVRLRAEISHLKTEIERHSKNSDLQMHRAIRAEDEAKRLRTCLVEAARLLTLEQLQQLSNSSVRALADIGLLVNQQTTVHSEEGK